MSESYRSYLINLLPLLSPTNTHFVQHFIIPGISSGSADFLDIVKALGEYLTSEEDDLRTKGVQMLSLVIERCPRDKLNRQAVRVLTTFYCSKLEDTETITPALRGLSHLVTFPSFSSLEVSDVLSSLFQQVKMKSLVQSTRSYVYSIVDVLINTYRDHLKNIGEQFLSGYAALASGEQDPRNLLVAFKIARVILTDFDISKHVETYFDITFCYYPIVFRPSPDDPYGINVDDLKDSLRSCLSATPAFGSLGISLFLEKLAVAPSLTKRDVLHTMAVCFPVYGINIAREFGRNVWNALKLEIFEPTDPLTEEMALDTLRVFVRVLLSSSDGADNTIDTVLQAICTDSLGFVGEPEKAQAKAGIKVLRTLIDVPSKLGVDAINNAMETLIGLFHDPGEVSNRAAVIALLADLLSAFVASVTPDPSTTTEQASEDLPPLIHSSLTSHKDVIIGMFIVGLKSSATRLPGIRGLSNLIRIPTLLTDSELGYIVFETGELARKEPDEAEDATTDVLLLLASIALTAPHHLANQTLPSLFAMLPEQAPSRDAQTERAEYWRALRILSKLCAQPTLFEILVIRLIAKLELLCSLSMAQEISAGGTPRAEEIERSAAYAHALLVTLANTLSTKVSKAPPDPDVPKYVDRLLSHLFRLFLVAAVTSERRIMQDQRLLRAGARIMKLVVEALSIEQQQRFIDGVGAAFLHGQVKAVTGGDFPPLTEEFKPIHVDASTHQRETVILFAAAHIPIRKEVSVMKNPDVKGLSVLSAFLRDLVRWCDLSTCSTLQRGAASELFATLVNKYADDVSDFLNEMRTSYFPATLNDSRVPIEARRKAMDNWVSISRGLVVRSHPLALSFIDSLLTLLDDETVAWGAAHALGLLVADDGVLTKRNGAVQKILHVQKYFNVVLPKVMDGANKVDGTKRATAYLIALASLVYAVPKSLYATQISTLMPLLLRGLEVAHPEIRWQIIETFSDNVSAFSDDELLSTYASTLVVTILKNCTVVDMPEHKVRVAALKCLALLPTAVRYDLLHPYKPRVLKDLAMALDDPKRAVRNEAVDARTKWYKYSG
ncbi:Dos2-interacting transcription regulator of RNA-Pol-II-domain-containing protein [Boletus reticuloceps]|uniref:MMS19 nucleotide excision repair protein n=1 Tax=Boletus reticuloceps TaxID=495285 RepID=A0A8I2Z0F9_9AGAM|nr:Dos2-interacting transcription regulator of RNA-Pol-II-domain-containing protein [Boletus reticuloceps]